MRTLYAILFSLLALSAAATPQKSALIEMLIAIDHSGNVVGVKFLGLADSKEQCESDIADKAKDIPEDTKAVSFHVACVALHVGQSA